MLVALQQQPVTSEYPSPVPELDEYDISSFEDFGELTTGIRFIDSHPDSEGHELGNLHRDFRRLFAATPFTEGERRWLYEEPSHRTQRGLGELVGQTAEILDAGVLQVVQGRDVVRRWWAWRRERDEFAGQGSLDEAREALGAMSLKLVSEKLWPPQFRTVLRELQDAA
jgi:hypothetical protein